MFTGIVESFGKVIKVQRSGTNVTFTIESSLSSSFKIDQSVSHSGVCLTVEAVGNETHQVTAIAETLSKTNLGTWEEGTIVNLEQCLPVNGRLDGHMVQGHVDAVGFCESVASQNGSWLYRFSFPEQFAPLVIEKGSICVNGVSLTAFGLETNTFCVAIIPYTFEHTNIHQVQPGHQVNLEFDIIGKYLARWKSLGL